VKPVLIALLLLLAAPAYDRSGAAHFSAQVDRTRLTVGENVQLILTLEGADLDISNPLPHPNLDEYFTMINASGPSTQQSISFVNGSMTKSIRLTMVYTFQAHKAGAVTIPALTYNSGGVQLQTAPIRLEILEANAPAPAHGDSTWSPPTDPYLEVKLDRSEVYVGEQAVASWYLYFINEFSNPRLERVPAAGDFMSEDLGAAQSINAVPRELGGQTWRTAFIKSIALYPIKAGDAILDPLVISLVPLGGRRGFFVAPAALESPPVKITVKPLPEEGKPAGFAGAVGEFTLSLDRASAALDANTPFKFTLTIRGTGYPDFIAKPAIELPPDFDLYTESADKAVEQENGRAIAVRRFKMIIVPHTAGTYDLPPFAIPYFDPRTGTYMRAESPAIHLQVNPGRALPLAAPETEPATLTTLAEDLRYLKPDRAQLDNAANLAASPLFLGAQFVPLLAVASAFLLRRRRLRLDRNPALARRLRANKKSRGFLREAKAAVRAGDTAAVCERSGRALLSYVADRFTLPEQGMTTADALAALHGAGVSDELVAETGSALGDCDRARYAALSFRPEEVAAMPRRVEDLIAGLAREGRG
jgi:hypothetical protein